MLTEVFEMADDNARMPSSQGGLVQYYEAETGIELDPRLVVAGCVSFSVFMVYLHYFVG